MTQPTNFTIQSDLPPCIHCGHEADDHWIDGGNEGCLECEASGIRLDDRCTGYEPDDRNPQQRRDDDWSD